MGTQMTRIGLIFADFFEAFYFNTPQYFSLFLTKNNKNHGKNNHQKFSGN